MSVEKNKVLRGITIHLITSSLNQIINFIKNVYLAKLLSNYNFGILNKGLYFVDFSTYFNFGGNQSFAVLYSKYLGQNEFYLASKTKFYGLIANIISIPFYIIIFIIIYILNIEGLVDNKLFTFLIITYSFLLLIQQLLSVIFRGDQKYYLFSSIGLIINLILLFSIYLLKDSLSIIIYSIILNLSIILICILMFPLGDIKFYKKLDKNYLYDFLKSGISINISNFLIFIFISLDRFFAVNYLDNESFALFSFAMLTIKGSSLLTNSAATILFPSIVKKYTSLNNKFQALTIINNINYFLVIINSIIVFFYVSFLPFFIIKYLNNYIESIKIMFYLIPLIIFLSLPVSNYDIILTQGKQKYVIGNLLLLTLIFIAMIFLYNLFFNVNIFSIVIFSNLIVFTYSILVMFISKKDIFDLKNNLISNFILLFFCFTPLFLVYIFIFTIVNDNFYLNLTNCIKLFTFLLLSYILCLKTFFNDKLKIFITELKNYAFKHK